MDWREWIRTIVQAETRKAVAGLQEQIKVMNRRIQKLEQERESNHS